MSQKSLHSPLESPKRPPHKPPLGIPQSKERPGKQICGNGTGVVGKLSNSTLNAADSPEQ